MVSRQDTFPDGSSLTIQPLKPDCNAVGNSRQEIVTDRNPLTIPDIQPTGKKCSGRQETEFGSIKFICIRDMIYQYGLGEVSTPIG